VQYGLEITPVVEPMTDVVRLTAPADLRRIAEWIGEPVQVLQDLNPELRRWTTPVRMTDYDLVVPMGTSEVLSARLADASPDDLAPLHRYSVRKGETIATIARKLKVKRADLAQANYLSERARITAGQQLIIPRAPTLLLASGDRTATDAPVAAVRDSDAEPDTVVAAVAPAPARRAVPEPSRVVHRVKRGETLSSIAQKYNTSVSAVRQTNKLRGSIIKVGQRLTINLPRGVQAD
jgi:membrane-bound lytic murein transglycosylase D